ncbi:MAG: YraN family protein [Candidatus Omnitrophica bacterium]|nr:YraN family protein [Candidatus Omnitrophota bacterium]
MKSENLAIGYLGEDIAKRYLQKKGYKIIERNYKTKYTEIDLIARDRKTLVFIEVRTKTKEEFGIPEESLNHNKINKLIRGATAYMIQKRYEIDYRIDAVCIVLEKNKKIRRLAHYQGVTL